MATNSGVGNAMAKRRAHSERINLGEHDLQTDADGRVFCSSEFVTPMATGRRSSWRWKLLRSGDGLFDFCIEPLSGCVITLSAVVLCGSNELLTWKKNIGQPRYHSGDFSVANRLPRLDKAFRRNHRCWIRLEVVMGWTETIPMSPASLIESQMTKVMDGGDSVYELVSSDGQSFSVNVTIMKAKSAYFERFFATEGWKEQMEGRMPLPWTSAVVKQLIRYVYLNTVDGDVCELLPDILDGSQMWELVGLKPLIEAQMKVRLQKAARDADTDTAAEYLKMAHLHGLASLVPLCNGVLADNYDKFFDSECCKQMFNSSEFAHLIKAVFHPKHNTQN